MIIDYVHTQRMSHVHMFMYVGRYLSVRRSVGIVVIVEVRKVYEETQGSASPIHDLLLLLLLLAGALLLLLPPPLPAPAVPLAGVVVTWLLALLELFSNPSTSVCIMNLMVSL